MKIKTEELQKALDFFRKNGGATEVNIEVDNNLNTRVIITGDTLGDTASITLFESDLNIFPKITKTENL